MTDINALKVLRRVIRDALEPKADDYQGEACAVFAAIRADTGQGAALRLAVLGLSGLSTNNLALWDRLDQRAPTSAQMIQWHAPHTAALLTPSEQAPQTAALLRQTRKPSAPAISRNTRECELATVLS
jgi:hypothetical protein